MESNELNVPAKQQTVQQECEEFIGCTITNEVNIHPPNDIRSRGRINRIKGNKEKGSKKGNNNKAKVSQLCEILSICSCLRISFFICLTSSTDNWIFTLAVILFYLCE